MGFVIDLKNSYLTQSTDVNFHFVSEKKKDSGNKNTGA